MTMKASQTITSLRSRAAITSAMSEAFSANAFPPARACRHPPPSPPIPHAGGGERDVDAVDRVGFQHRLVGAEGMARAELVGQRARLATSRLAMADRTPFSAATMAGMSCSRPIFAVDRTPQRTWFSPP